MHNYIKKLILIAMNLSNFVTITTIISSFIIFVAYWYFKSYIGYNTSPKPKYNTSPLDYTKNIKYFYKNENKMIDSIYKKNIEKCLFYVEPNKMSKEILKRTNKHCIDTPIELDNNIKFKTTNDMLSMNRVTDTLTLKIVEPEDFLCSIEIISKNLLCGISLKEDPKKININILNLYDIVGKFMKTDVDIAMYCYYKSIDPNDNKNETKMKFMRYFKKDLLNIANNIYEEHKNDVSSNDYKLNNINKEEWCVNNIGKDDKYANSLFIYVFTYYMSILSAYHTEGIELTDIGMIMLEAERKHARKMVLPISMSDQHEFYVQSSERIGGYYSLKENRNQENKSLQILAHIRKVIKLLTCFGY